MTASLVVPMAGTAFAVNEDDVASITVEQDAPRAAAGDYVTFTVTATDGNGDPVVGAEISAEVTNGSDNADPALTRDTFCTTDVNGQCDVDSDAGIVTDPGTDTWRFWADLNANDAYNNNEVSETATVQYYGPPTALTLTPLRTSNSTANCALFTVEARDANGLLVGDAEVDISRTHSNATDAGNAELGFCGSGVDATYVDPVQTDATDDNNQRAEVIATDDSGTATFGITSTLTGTDTVFAWLDQGQTHNGVDDGVEGDDARQPTETRTPDVVVTWTESGQDAVAALVFDEVVGDAYEGGNRTLTVTATNDAGDPMAGVTVEYTFDGTDPITEGTVGPTDNAGQTEITVSAPDAGTYTATAWVEQSDGTGAGWQQPAEPGDTASVTFAIVPDGDLALTFWCSTPTLMGSQNSSELGDGLFGTCDSALDVVDVPVMVKLFDDVNMDGIPDEDEAGIAGVRLVADLRGHSAGSTEANMSIKEGTGTGEESMFECVTDADGMCSFHVSAVDPQDGNDAFPRVFAPELEDAGALNRKFGGDHSTDSTPPFTTMDNTGGPHLNIDWEEREAYDWQYSTNQVEQHDTSATVWIRVVDQFLAPLAGYDVDFTLQGGGHNLPSTDGQDMVTDVNGVASWTFTDDNPATTSPVTDTVDVVHPESSTTIDVTWIDVAPTASSLAIDADGGCDDVLDHTNPGWVDSENHTVTSAPDWHFVCASAYVEDADGDRVELEGHDISYTSTGVGTLNDYDPLITWNLNSPEYEESFMRGTGHDVTISWDGWTGAVSYVNSVDAGDQVITASIDGLSETATIEWLADTTPRSLEMSVLGGAVKDPGSTGTVVIKVLDKLGNGIPGVTVGTTTETVKLSFTGVGAWESGGVATTTNADGEARAVVSTDPAEEGIQTVKAALPTTPGDDPCEADAGKANDTTTDEAGTIAGSCEETVDVIWSDVNAISLDVPAAAAQGSTVAAVATVSAPEAGHDVVFTVTGANAATATVLTDGNGKASMAYTATNLGTDTVTAFIDLNGNGTNDQEPTATKTVEVTEANEVIRLSGGGRDETNQAQMFDIFKPVAGGGAGRTASAHAKIDALGAVIARNDVYADALSGTALAVAKQAPLIITSSNGLSTVSSNTLETLVPKDKTVYLLGGENALSPSVESEIKALGYTNVIRLNGPTRFETAIEIAKATNDNPNDIMVTTGLNFPDALAAGAAAAKVGGVVVLSAGDDAHPATTAFLAQNAGASTYAVGGPASRAYPAAEKVAGTGREATAVEVAEKFFSAPEVTGVSRGDAFPDALGGGAHIGFLGGPLLLTPTSALNVAAKGYLEGNAASLTTAYVYGGPNAISASTATEIENAIS